MQEKDINKMNQLMQIADADEVYTIWRKSREDFAASFEAYADAQPEEVRNILWGYAGAGEMMWQRMLNLACEHMTFTK